jgi:hypothetical protein
LFFHAHQSVSQSVSMCLLRGIMWREDWEVPWLWRVNYSFSKPGIKLPIEYAIHSLITKCPFWMYTCAQFTWWIFSFFFFFFFFFFLMHTHIKQNNIQPTSSTLLPFGRESFIIICSNLKEFEQVIVTNHLYVDSPDRINRWTVQFLFGHVNLINGISQLPIWIISNLNK